MSDTNNPACPKPGHFSWNELLTTDTKASSEFYGKLFGWKAEAFVPPGTPAGAPPYLVFKTQPGDQMGAGGMMQAPAPGIPTHWLAYVIVENADQSLATAVKLGAKALTPVMAIGMVGRVAVIQDPLGAVIGLHEPAK
ncbi:MAG: VOC family protein [Verrucomicrobia bacterium]|nr:VOC family protein [Verrucomicrobiota bacterium]